jgi:hypothetical protein
MDDLEEDEGEDEALEDYGAADEPPPGPFLLGKVVKDVHRSGAYWLQIFFAEKEFLCLRNLITLRGDQGRGFLALLGATLDDVDFQLEAITLTFSGGATIRVGLAPEDYEEYEPNAMEYQCGRFFMSWEDGRSA